MSADENIVICPAGHTIGVRATHESGNAIERGPGRGFGVPCPSCGRFYWDAFDGKGLVPLGALEFVILFTAVHWALTSGDPRAQEEAKVYGRLLVPTAVEVIRRERSIYEDSEGDSHGG